MKIFRKFLLSIIIINLLIMFMYLMNFNVHASTISDMESKADSFISAGKGKTAGMDKVAKSVTNNFKGIGQLLTLIGAGVMVAVVSYMGIKYMISPPDKQAVLKQQLIGVVVAGIVIFGAYGIWKAVVGVVSKF